MIDIEYHPGKDAYFVKIGDGVEHAMVTIPHNAHIDKICSLLEGMTNNWTQSQNHYQELLNDHLELLGVKDAA